ncbi:MAG TPA: Crp/Fnr family transcriptional regulator [Rhizomicrobium sp.]|nr:Crp/Fnr family transcriptional regulator [Rhizomicrobium sp.]
MDAAKTEQADRMDPRSSKIVETLGKNAVLGVLSLGSRQVLARNGSPVELPRGVELFRRGDTSDAAYAILSGEIEVSLPGLDGRDVWIARLGAGTVVGEMGSLDGSPRSADARATRKCELWKISRTLIMEALHNEPSAALALLEVLVRRLRDTDALVERNSSMSLGKRLARLLLDESTKGRIIYNQAELAHLIGATREAVNRKLSSWRKSNWIEITPTGLHVRDRAALLVLCKRVVDS